MRLLREMMKLNEPPNTVTHSLDAYSVTPVMLRTRDACNEGVSVHRRRMLWQEVLDDCIYFCVFVFFSGYRCMPPALA